MKETKQGFIVFVSIILVCFALAAIVFASGKELNLKDPAKDTTASDGSFEVSGEFVDTSAPVDTMPAGIDVPNDNSNAYYPVSYYDESSQCGYVCDGSRYFFYKRVFNFEGDFYYLDVDLSKIQPYGGFLVDVYMLPGSYGGFLKGTSCRIEAQGSSDICYTTVNVSSSVDPMVILEDLKQNVFFNELYFSYTTSYARG